MNNRRADWRIRKGAMPIASLLPTVANILNKDDCSLYILRLWQDAFGKQIPAVRLNAAYSKDVFLLKILLMGDGAFESEDAAD